jgi:hypothetical protein
MTEALHNVTPTWRNVVSVQKCLCRIEHLVATLLENYCRTRTTLNSFRRPRKTNASCGSAWCRSERSYGRCLQDRWMQRRCRAGRVRRTQISSCDRTVCRGASSSAGWTAERPCGAWNLDLGWPPKAGALVARAGRMPREPRAAVAGAIYDWGALGCGWQLGMYPLASAAIFSRSNVRSSPWDWTR